MLTIVNRKSSVNGNEVTSKDKNNFGVKNIDCEGNGANSILREEPVAKRHHEVSGSLALLL